MISVSTMIISLVYISLYFLTITNGQSEPNIVVFVADDVGWNDVGYNGATDCYTPNLDLLSENGLQLNQFYVHPLCSPTRAALLTGRYIYRYGFQNQSPTSHTIECGLNLNETLWSQVLQNNGYKTYMLGKWHLGYYQWDYTPNYRGFDEFVGFYGFQESYLTYDYQSGIDFRNNTTPFNATTTGEYAPDLYSDITDQWLDEIINNPSDNQPFALYIANQVAHMPIETKDEYVTAVEDEMSYGSEIRKNYCSMVYSMDKSLGELITKLNSSDLWDNTILIFFSDNGPNDIGSAWPLRGSKRTYFEGGIRTPAIISGGLLPNNRRGIIENELTHVIDIFSTICSITNINCTEYELDGINLYDYIIDGTSLNRDYLLLNVDQSQCTTNSGICGGIRYGDWKLVIGDQLIGGGSNIYYWDINYIDNPSINYTNSIIQCNGIEPTVNNYTDSGLSWDCGYSNMPCLFNITNDPCEYNDLSGANIDIVIQLITELTSHYNQQITPLQLTCDYNDTASDPINFNGFWSPWRTSPTGANGTNWVVTPQPTLSPTDEPSIEPSPQPSLPPSEPSLHPTEQPTRQPTEKPTEKQTEKPTEQPTEQPTINPTTVEPTTSEPTTPHPTVTVTTVEPTNMPSSPPTGIITPMPTVSPIEAIECIEPCNDMHEPCSCDDVENCEICHIGTGCSKCNGGYFKPDYDYSCFDCQEIFGEECLFCQDFNGCGQCQSNCNRIYDHQCSLWKCEC